MKEGTVNEFIHERGFPEARGVPETGYVRIEDTEAITTIPPHTYTGTISGHWGDHTICFNAGAGTLRVNGNSKLSWEDENKY